MCIIKIKNVHIKFLKLVLLYHVVVFGNGFNRDTRMWRRALSALSFDRFTWGLIRNAGSTSWPSDAIPMRKNQAFMNRSAEVRLVARRRTRRGWCTVDGRPPNETGARRADIVDLRSRPHRGMTFPLLDPQCRPFP